MAGVLFGLLAAACYGSADFCGGLATKRTSIWAVTVLSQGAGLAVLVLLVHFFPGDPHAARWWLGAAAGVCGSIGIALLYHALAVGEMSVVSPITAVLAAILPVGLGTFAGERVSAIQYAGILLALVAIALMAGAGKQSLTEGLRGKGIREACASGIALGGFYVLLARSGPEAGLYPLVAARIAGVLVLAAGAVFANRSLAPRRGSLRLIAGGGVLDMGANMLYMLATFNGALGIAAVLTSLYPGATVALAWSVLRERVRPLQYAGALCAVAGVVLIAVHR